MASNCRCVYRPGRPSRNPLPLGAGGSMGEMGLRVDHAQRVRTPSCPFACPPLARSAAFRLGSSGRGNGRSLLRIGSPTEPRPPAVWSRCAGRPDRACRPRAQGTAPRHRAREAGPTGSQPNQGPGPGRQCAEGRQTGDAAGIRAATCCPNDRDVRKWTWNFSLVAAQGAVPGGMAIMKSDCQYQST